MRFPSAWALAAVSATVFYSTPAGADPSVARQWDDQALAAIRIDLPRPPVHARNLFHLSAAMYDAWAALDTNNVTRGFFHDEKVATTQDMETARAEAISYAAYRVLAARYKLSVNSTQSLNAFSAKMTALGYPTNVTTTVGSTPAALGNRVAATILALGINDGANETNNYKADNGYAPANIPLIVKLPGTVMSDPNRWQPLALDYAVTQNGIEADKIQSFVGPHWGAVTPFALMRLSPTNVYEDRGLPPRLGSGTDSQFKQEMVRVIELSGELDPDDNAVLNISPGAMGNNSLGYNDGSGYPTNPVTGLSYSPNVVRRGDFGRVLAEFWADGPSSETPPGHWNVLANQVSSNISPKRIGGAGPAVSDLEWDVKMYLGLNGALHDAAVAAWNHKGVYDSVRPISAIRYMGGLGQCSDTNAASFHIAGLPLVSGLIELITTNSIQLGERHEALATNVGEMAIRTWPGQPTDPTNQYSGARWIRAVEWLPYQKNTFVTPPFAAFISGHSTFSRAAAEYLTAFTGSKFFPGGLGEFVAPSNTFLTFEKGPTQSTRLQWATYYDAADQAGFSRLWGGIHIDADDREGRKAGSRIGRAAYQLAQQYFVGWPEPHPPFDVAMGVAPGGHDMLLQWPTKPGRRYVVQTSSNLKSFANASGVYTAGVSSITWTNSSGSGAVLHFRVIAGSAL